MTLPIGMAAFAAQRLTSLLAQFSPAQTSATGSATAASAATTIGDASTATDTTSATAGALSGSTQPSLSSQILATLMQLQGANASGTQSVDPLQNLFTAMDTDGDGAISQGEMETYLEKAGATQGQADALYSAIDTGGSGGISETQLGSALPTTDAGSAQGPHHHHHHHHAQGAGADPASILMQAIDSNGDGSVSQDEMTSFVTANGGTADQAQSDFTALGGSGTTGVTSADFAKAWETLQQSQDSGSSGQILLSMLNAFAGASSTAASTTTVATA